MPVPSRMRCHVLLRAALGAALICLIGFAIPTARADASIAVIDTGGHPTCAIDDGGVLKCWGDNFLGTLGLGDERPRGDDPNEMGGNLPAVDLGTGRSATEVALGHRHTCAVLDDGAVKCWGSNSAGRLGLGDEAARGDQPNEMGDDLPPVSLGTGRTAAAVGAGVFHTCALLDDDSVKCWGNNSLGQIGLTGEFGRGDEPNEMGDNLPSVDLGAGRTVTEISVGSWHSCALLDGGAVKCWGDGSLGRLGLGDANPRGDNPGEMGDNLPAVALGTGRTATAISAGGYHTCALLDNGAVKCWGHNGSGQLGLGVTDNRGDEPGEMGDNLPAVDLGAGRTAIAISTGDEHSCALLDNGAVKCWGQNGSGRLGLGDTDHRGDEPNEMGDNLPAVSLGTGRTATAISAGETHTCAILDNEVAKCWGRNDLGQLGVGDGNARGDEPNEMGEALPAADFAAPTAVPDVRRVGMDSRRVTFHLTANDTDIDGGLRTIASVTQPAHGSTAVIANRARVSYVPDPRFCGLDSFSYTLAGGSTATVGLAVPCAPPVRLAPGRLRAFWSELEIALICPRRFDGCNDVRVRIVGRPARGAGRGVLIASLGPGRISDLATPGLSLTPRGQRLIAKRGGVMRVLAITSSAESKTARQRRTVEVTRG